MRIDDAADGAAVERAGNEIVGCFLAVRAIGQGAGVDGLQQSVTAGLGRVRAFEIHHIPINHAGRDLRRDLVRAAIVDGDMNRRAVFIRIRFEKRVALLVGVIATPARHSERGCGARQVPETRAHDGDQNKQNEAGVAQEMCHGAYRLLKNEIYQIYCGY